MRDRTCRPGFTYLEVEVALAVFGITLAGLGSIVEARLRAMRALERRVYCQVPQGTSLELVRSDGALLASSTVTNTVLLSAEAWARKLGAGAPLVTAVVGIGSTPKVVTSPSPLQPPSAPYEVTNLVSIVEPAAGGDPSTVRVSVTPIASGP